MRLRPSAFHSVLLTLLLTVGLATPCSFPEPPTAFQWILHPDLPLDTFAAGQIGVLRPSYARSYLIVAYAHMSGAVIPESQQEQLTRLWAHRLGLDRLRRYDPASEWLKARNALPKSVGPEVGQALAGERTWTRDRETGVYYGNCLDDAFETARLTLQKRVAAPGLKSERLKEWVEAQDMVFSNCSMKTPLIPEPLAPTAELTRRQDRDYQIASALFYSGELGKAEAAFQRIASDVTSPWRALSAYLVGRAMFREVMRAETPPLEGELAAAQAYLEKTLAAPNTPIAAGPARSLLARIRNRTEPQARLKELSKRFLSGQSITMADDLDHLLTIVRNQTESYPEPPVEPADLRPTSDLLDWTITFAATGDEPLAHSLERWKARHSVPWLVAALSKVGAKDGDAPALTLEAGKVKPESPAFSTVAFHLARIQEALGQLAAARTTLDRALDDRTAKLGGSAFNLLLEARASVASDFDDFLAHASQRPIGSGFTDSQPGEPCEVEGSPSTCGEPLLGPRAEHDLMRMPLSYLTKAVNTRSLNPFVRRWLLWATWTRAIALNRDDDAVALAKTLSELDPESAKRLERYLKAVDVSARLLEAAFVLVDTPLSPKQVTDHYPLPSPGSARIDDNAWKCGDPNPTDPGTPHFLPAKDVETGAAEWATLLGVGSGPKFIAGVLATAADKDASDPRLPEGLHKAVMAGKWGCYDGPGEAAASRRAFQALHRHYPKSEWAKQTKYWYGSN